MIQAVRANITTDKIHSVLLSCEDDGLRAPFALPDGTVPERDRGTPQG